MFYNLVQDQTPELRDLVSTGLSLVDLQKIGLLGEVDSFSAVVNDLFKKAQVNPLRRPRNSFKLRETEDLVNYHNEQNSSQIIEMSGISSEEDFSSLVGHATIRDPLINIPRLLNFLTQPFFLSIASGYFDAPAFLTYVKVKRSYPHGKGTGKTSYNQVFHRDDNSGKLIKLFIYLSDVQPYTGGGFKYVKESKRYKPSVTYFEDKELQENFRGNPFFYEMAGRTGLCVLADTKGIHAEGVTSSSPRTIIIANYSTEPEYEGSSNPADQLRALAQDIDSLRADALYATRFVFVVDR